ncbi:FtsX-like permease family protein [Marivirga salinae]|uniref:FtsX-like permease family protein n=1 Tax=Marivirga salinarum TaxID=3059078 RepID=A0AA51RBN2_9BACT|nr:FtsX-like permease family protein [Marivirga sp. BDSF4-3]WMN12451.1 FtsX-like permease family protein [Marivirga sp. BDSF4-3]
MKLAFQLAYRNLVGAGLRTWLNVGILAFTFIVIIFFNGYLDGWNLQAQRESIKWEYGNGQLRHQDYDPLDPFTLTDAHGKLESGKSGNLSPILIRQASLYPEGRMISILMKGIDANQETLSIPTEAFQGTDAGIPALIGQRMANSNNLKVGDQVLLRWRDKNGTFDASEITITEIFETDVAGVDLGQIWIPIEKLWEMTELNGHATYFVANEKYEAEKLEGWEFSSKEELLNQLKEIIEMKSASSSILYLLLLGIALLAIFDTQVLSIFRRQKEIGTYIALGMTRWQVVKLFTIEGSMYSLMASVVGIIIGTPIFWYFATNGIGMPEYVTPEDMGITIAQRIYPAFSIGLLLGTLALVVISATIVSFLPSRKIAKMDPVDALKGKVQ